jgi:hypothetical protein
MVHGSKLYRLFLSSAVGLGVLTFGVTAFAASEEEEEEDAPAVPKPVRTPRPVKAETPDHGHVVGHLGVGYFGHYDIGVGAAGDIKGGVELVGVRYWFQEKLGLDVAIGLGMTSGSDTKGGTSVDRRSQTSFALAGGVPIVLFDAKHYLFFVEPMIRLGHGGATDKAAAGDTSHSGNHFQIGGRIGAEVSFGFIGIPHLSLDANVGLDIDIASGSTAPPTGDQSSYSQTTISTITGHRPWDIFTSAVAAIYYF